MRRLPTLFLALAAVVCTTAAAAAVAPVTGGYPRPGPAMNAAAIELALRKLEVVGSALYVGAHPDDENTAFLSWLSSGRMVRAAYLSVTRGDGGQNLIGSETGEALVVIRTQELLAARRVDGAEQFFTRALDFGFSKNPDETLAIWGHDRILADVVWVIRSYRPALIVPRLAPEGGGGQGPHTASAILAEEAWSAAADPARFTEQLTTVKPWRAKRLLWNAYRFGSSGADTTRDRLRVDLGAFNPLLGRSYTEIAGESRSMHMSQGAGTPERRGTWENTFEHRLGDRATQDLFEGVDLTWSRFQGGDVVAGLLARAGREFDRDHPAALPINQPYWLKLPALKGSHQVADPAQIGRAENDPALAARVVLSGFGERVELVIPIVYRWPDPALGDRYRPLEVAPAASCRFDQGVYLFPTLEPRTVRLVVESPDSTLQGVARL